MAKDNAIDFTENRYASRKEMSNEIGIVVPNEMWNKVLAYRNTFTIELPLKDANDKKLTFCLYPTLSSKCSQVEAKLLRLVNNSGKLDSLSGDKQHFRLTMLVNTVKTLAETYKIEIEEARIKKLIVSENPYDDDEERLLNYVLALNYIEERYVNNIDVDFLAELYSRVTGVSELTYFYRSDDLVDIDSIALVGRVYRTAPYNKIEEMMDSLFNFLANSGISNLNKAFIAYYYVTYIRPFKDFNDEIACLIAKAILAHDSLGEAAIYLPFEKILLSRVDYVRKVYQEILNTADVTYFSSPFIFKFDKDLDEPLDILREYSLNEVRRDFYQLDEVEEVEPEVEEPAPLFEEKEEEPEPVVKEEVVQEEPQEDLEPEIEEEEPVVVEPIKEEKEENEGGIETISLFDQLDDEELEPEPDLSSEKGFEDEKEVVEEVEVVPPTKEEQPIKVETVEESKPVDTTGLAVSFIPRELDEKDARRLEEHLLELDIRLKKGEAKFYARHCTMGMYYTIEQYRKLNKCVYETARTSMDHLAELGYYKKTKEGKKFVYTPIKR